MTNDEIKRDIIEACEEFQAEGYRLIRGSFFGLEDEPCGGCALAAVAYVHGGIEPVEDEDDEDRIPKFAQARYGWSDAELEAFVNGYDAITRLSADENHPLYAVGRAVCDEVHPVEAGTL